MKNVSWCGVWFIAAQLKKSFGNAVRDFCVGAGANSTKVCK